MSIKNKISKGMHADFSEHDQPEGTYRYSRNGILSGTGSGNYTWTNLKSHKLIHSFAADDVELASCSIRERRFILALDPVADLFKIYEIAFKENGEIDSVTTRLSADNSVIGFHKDYPIRSILGFYEQEDKQYIYFTDNKNKISVINVAGSGSISINEKFLSFYPEMDPVHGKISNIELVDGGYCKAGTYFITWRLYHDGYYTDWTPLSSPIHTSTISNISSFTKYQESHGLAPNESVDKSINFDIVGIDQDYDQIELAVFYSNDFNSSETGFIFSTQAITGSTMSFTLHGNEMQGMLVIEDIIRTSFSIETCKEISQINNQLILGNITEREEIDVSSLHSTGRNDQMEVSMIPISHPVVFDERGFPYENITGSSKALHGTYSLKRFMNIGGNDFDALYPNVWYYVNGPGSITIGANEYLPGQVFQTGAVSVRTIFSQGNPVPCIVKSKYLKNDSDPNDINTWELDIIKFSDELLSGSSYNYKNPLFTNHLKSYPGDETVRFGIVFVDKTGRPFYARHLYNTEVTHDSIEVGPGDFKTPNRHGRYTNKYKLIDRSFGTVGIGIDDPPFASGDIFSGNSIGVRISGIDVTPFRDRIGGFYIVRAPILRKIAGYGLLNRMVKLANDKVTLRLGYSRIGSTGNSFANGRYDIISPEDIFRFPNFLIEKGDKIENIGHLMPMGSSHSGREDLDSVFDGRVGGYEGLGRMINNIGNCLYLKMLNNLYEGDGAYPANANAQIGAKHDVLSSYRYMQGDGTDVQYNNDDPTELFTHLSDVYKDGSYINFRSHAGNSNLLVLNINEAVDGSKIAFHNNAETDVYGTMCAIRKGTPMHYSGLEEADLANTIYIPTGHYQPVNEDVLNSIEDNGNYVFNNIDVYGGDSFLCLFDFTRHINNRDTLPAGLTHSVIFPIETRVNIDMRDGRHVSKDLADNNDIGTGLYWKSGFNRWEEFNYNKGYSSDDVKSYFVPIPFNQSLKNQFDNCIRFSVVKSYGEREDSFRRFNAMDRIDVEANFGPINNIRAINDRLVYWQEDSVGYIPVGERALSSMDSGVPIQLGVSGRFERYDKIITKIGNSHQYGLVESLMGFHWYDAKRKLFIALPYSLQLDIESIAKGMDLEIIRSVPDIITVDNPITGDRGVVGSYDQRNKIAFIRIMQTVGQTVYKESFGIDVKNNFFVGTFDQDFSIGFTHKDRAYHIINPYEVGAVPIIKLFEGGSDYGSYVTSMDPQMITIVINEPEKAEKVFDNYMLIGGTSFFTEVQCATETQSVTETVQNNRNYKYRNHRWYGNFPQVIRERLIGNYLKITFVNRCNDNVLFNELETFVRKML